MFLTVVILLVCIVTCAKARQFRLSFHISVTRSNTNFEPFHVDVWGPFKVPSLTGARYFLTLVKDFSICT